MVRLRVERSKARGASEVKTLAGGYVPVDLGRITRRAEKEQIVGRESYRGPCSSRGGAAGMGTAYYAARLGLNVALLEKERFPRDRVCGDGMLA